MPFLKPQDCEGCPFQYLSKYITPDAIIPGSEVLILAQNPGQHEELGLKIVGDYWEDGKKADISEKVKPQPLIGRSGKWLQEEFWPLTKLPYGMVSRANVIKCRPYDVNDLPNIGGGKAVKGITVTLLKEAIANCTKKYLKIPATVKHILAMGEVSLYALSGEELLNYRKHQSIEIDGETTERKSTISEWRGWGLEYDKRHRAITAGLYDYYDCKLSVGSWDKAVVFPVIHIAALFESDKLYHATVCDFRRFGQLVRGEWPHPVPDMKINYIPKEIPGLIGFDTEYTRDKQLIMWSLADVGKNIYIVSAEHSRKLLDLPDRLSIVTQNGLVDIPFFVPLLPDGFRGRITLHDCMLAHALVWAGERTSLDYQLSKVGEYNRHKHLLVNILNAQNKDLGYLYAGLDAETTLNSAWRHLAIQFKKDERVHREYLERRQPLLHVIHRSEQRGVALDHDRIEAVGAIYEAKVQRIQERVRELTGNPDFNIRSDADVGLAVHQGIFSVSSVEKKVPRKNTKKAARARNNATMESIDTDGKDQSRKGLGKKLSISRKIAQLQIFLGIE